MAELQCTLYLRHPERTIHNELQTMVNSLSSDKEAAITIAQALNPEHGLALTQKLFADMEEYLEEVHPESVEASAGFWVIHMVNGGMGDHLLGALVRYFHDLKAGTQAQAWGCGDDDPWEFWFKMEGDRLIRLDDEPYEGRDQRIKGTIYRWWHESMPDAIKEGILNEDLDEDDIDDPDEFDELDDEDTPVKDHQYQAWLAKLKKSRTKDPEPPMSRSDVKELVSGFGALFSAFSGMAKADKAPKPEPFRAEQLTEDIVKSAFDDLNTCEQNLDVNGVLKHYSPNLKGKVTDRTGKVGNSGINYSLYKMGLVMMLKPASAYQGQSEIRSLALQSDGSVVLCYDTVSQMKDIITGSITRYVSDDKMVWRLEDGKVQIVELYNTMLEATYVN